MKYIKSRFKDHHKVEINAKFIKNGYYPHWVYEQSQAKDMVKLEATISDFSDYTNPVELTTFTKDAWVGKHVEVIEKRRFRKDITKLYSLHEEYEIALEQLEKSVDSYIDNRNYNLKMTDGLPDSLLDLV